MTAWIIAALAGTALSFGLYLWRESGPASRVIPLALLRAAALTIIFALLFDAPAGPPRELPSLVALDASRSWLRGGDSTAWQRALARVRRLSPDSLLLSGDSVRVAAPPPLPLDDASRAMPLVERSLAAGRPLTLITDGEIEDASALRELPRGSRVEVIGDSARPDLGVVSIEAPRAVVSGDSVDVGVVLRAAPAGATATKLRLLFAGEEVAQADIGPSQTGAERRMELRAALGGPDGSRLLTALLDDGGAEPRNDTLSVAVEVAEAAGAVLVSSSPDQDSRFMVAVLRGAVSLPTRAFYRVAPGAWRVEGTLAPVSEAVVRRAVRDAPLVILHGDTAIFGAPRAVTKGALALVIPPRTPQGEWYAQAAAASPISGALTGIEWDSLAPIEVSRGAPDGDWEALSASQPRTNERRVAMVGSGGGGKSTRRTVIVPASGMWRWRFRGGVGADAYDALWGSIFDWLTAEPVDRRAAIPADAVIRAGQRIRWRRGSAGDSVVRVELKRRYQKREAASTGVERGGGGPTSNATATDSLELRFGATGTIAESDPLLPGVYDVTMPGGSMILVVNASPELLPRARSVASGAVGGAPLAGDAPRLRSVGWIYLLAVAALCAEWLLRRRMGMR